MLGCGQLSWKGQGARASFRDPTPTLPHLTGIRTPPSYGGEAPAGHGTELSSSVPADRQHGGTTK